MMQASITGSKYSQSNPQEKRDVKKIGLFGLFGVGNLGNESTLQAFLLRIREDLPDAEITCICVAPEIVTSQHHIPAVPIDVKPGSDERTQANFFSRIAHKVLVRVPMEFILWIQAYKQVRQFDLLIIVGTGILDDFGVGPFQMPYDLFKWCAVAKLSRTKLLFVSVGAGPIVHQLSRLFMKSAMGFADYRSYRDQLSKQYMESIGFNTKHDQVYPDLVFSLPKRLTLETRSTSKAPEVIGIGVMAYYGWKNSASHGEEIYQRYIDKMVDFVTWLLRQGYTVRMLIGETGADERAVVDITERLAQCHQPCSSEQIISEIAGSVEELFDQIATTDLVVATRFHNVIFSLMLNKPVVSIGYAAKNDVLMAEMGLGEYCQQILDLDVERLKEQFSKLVQNYHSSIQQIERKNKEHRQALDEQYKHIFHRQVSLVRSTDLP